MHANYLLNKTNQAIKIRCRRAIYYIKLTKGSKYGACKIFIKQNSPSDQNTVHANYLLTKLTKRSKYGACKLFNKQNSQSDQITVHARYLLNKTRQAIKYGACKSITKQT